MHRHGTLQTDKWDHICSQYVPTENLIPLLTLSVRFQVSINPPQIHVLCARHLLYVAYQCVEQNVCDMWPTHILAYPNCYSNMLLEQPVQLIGWGFGGNNYIGIQGNNSSGTIKLPKWLKHDSNMAP